MLRKSGGLFLADEKVNGYAPEKVALRPHHLRVNGYAPEKSGILSDYIHFYVLLWTNGHQKEAFSTLLATGLQPRNIERVCSGICMVPRSILLNIGVSISKSAASWRCN